MTATPLRPAHRTPALMDDYQRTMAVANAPLTVACKLCHQPREMECRSSGGYTVPPHAVRVRDVEHLTDDEKVAAAAATFAEQDRRRAEVDAHMARLEADPQWVAQRNATRAYINAEFDRIREEGRAAERDFRARCTDTPFLRSRTHADGCRCKVTGDVEYTPAFVEARRLRDLRGTLPVTDLAAVRARRGTPTGPAVV